MNATTNRALGALCALAALLVAITAGGCGGASSEVTAASKGGIGKAEAAVAAGRKPASWKAPGPEIADTVGVRGKTFYYIGNGLDLAPIQAIVKGLKEATSAVGMKLEVADGRGQPAQVSQQIDRAISLNAAVIATTSFEGQQIGAAVERARDAGIDVILGTAGDPELPSAADRKLGVSALVTFCYTCAGRELADAAIAGSEGNVNAVAFDVPESRSAVIEAEATVEEIETICPGCNVSVRHAPLTQWTTGLQSLTSSTLKSDPTINYLIPVWDPMVAYMKPAVAALGKSEDVSIATYNGSIEQLTDLSEGEMVQTDIGSPFSWIGYGMVDQALRVLSGAAPAKSENVPNRIFDSSNVDDLHLDEGLSISGEVARYGVDFPREYKRLWGLE
ncbi:MAG TPA: substrate-binding domain-containing protein [Solirubrobacterales bacterium]|nr:substrate-binding domain-containing protein [Solirubrobacterales bacterium]